MFGTIRIRRAASGAWTCAAGVCLAAGILSAAPVLAATASPPGREFLVDRLPADLSGIWEISFGASEPPLAPAEAGAWRPVQVPGMWQSSGYASHGIAWLRARIRLEPALATQALAFATTQIRDAEEVYFDGILIGSTGGFPPNYQKATLIDRVYELPPDLTTRPGPHVLLLKIFNAGPRGGGITGPPRIDRVAAALGGQFRRDMVRMLFGAGIGAIGLVVLIFYLRDREQREFLFFFLYALSISAYQVTWLSGWKSAGLSLSWQFRLNMCFVFLVLAFYVLFNLRVFGHPLRRHHLVSLGAIATLAILSLLWPRVDDLYRLLAADEILFFFVAAEMIWILFQDARHGVRYAAAVLAGTLLSFAAASHDILQDLGFLGDPAGKFRLLGPAIFLFTVAYLWVMADRFARAIQAASTDALTGLPNRKLLFERLSSELARSRRSGSPCTLAILDLDHFKTFNDRFGHLAGDRFLRSAAAAVKSCVRESDLVARYGGEEFVVVLPGSNRPEALVCLERIRRAVSEVRVGTNPAFRTASIGAVVYDPGDQPSIAMMPLLRNADAALYSAKSGGRNRILFAEGPLRETISGLTPLPRTPSDDARLPS